MNAANAVSLFRLALIPVFVALLVLYQADPSQESLRLGAFWVFAVAAISDSVDGFIARRFDQKTRLGAVLDPLADKLLINIAFIFLAALPPFDATVPQWVPVVILARDITIAGGSFLLNKYMGPLKVRPRLLGKVATWAHSIAIGYVVIGFPHAYEVLMVTVSISVLSLADYLFHGYESAVPVGHEGDLAR